jgi:hypothetical protein
MKIARIPCPNIVTIKAGRSNNERKFRRYVSWLYLRPTTGMPLCELRGAIEPVKSS